MKISYSDKSERNSVVLRSTKPVDIDWVLPVEKKHDNAIYVGQWTKEEHLNAINDQNIAHFIIERENGDGSKLGYVILVGVNDVNNSVHFRRIVVDLKGKGVGRKAIRCIKHYVFDILGMHRLWLNVLDINEPAQFLYSREGFTREGISRDAVKVSDKTYRSYIVMSMLDCEYKELEKKND